MPEYIFLLTIIFPNKDWIEYIGKYGALNVYPYFNIYRYSSLMAVE